MPSDDAFETLVSGLDYPMFIVTARSGTQIAGCLAGFVTQASIDPPRLLVLISTSNHTYDVAQHAEYLIVHFLTTDNHDLAALFGEESGDATDKFARCDWTPGPHDVPVLDGVRGWVAGRVLNRFDAGDHVAHLLEIVEGQTDHEGPALTYQHVRDLTAGHDA